MISKCPRKGSTQISIHTSEPLSQWPLSSARFFIHPGATRKTYSRPPQQLGHASQNVHVFFSKMFPRQKCPYRNFFPEEIPLKGSIMNFLWGPHTFYRNFHLSTKVNWYMSKFGTNPTDIHVGL